MYVEKGVSFLLNSQETIKECERNGKLQNERREKIARDAIRNSFNSMPHVAKIKSVGSKLLNR